MKRRIRFLLVPRYMVVLAVAVYAIFFGGFDLYLWRLGVGQGELGPEFSRMQMMPICMAAVCYGGYRVISTHPLFRLDYGKWLANSPWRAGMDLPLGPVQLAWQDVLMMAVFALWSSGIGAEFHLHFHPAPPVICLLGAYLLVSLVSLAFTRQFGAVVVMVAIVPVTFYLWNQWWLMLGVMAVIYAVALYGLHGSWRTFPWDDIMMQRLVKIRRGQPQSIAWPFDRLNGQNPKKIYDLRWIVLIAVMVGWYVFAILDNCHDPDVRDPLQMASMLAILGCTAAACRLILYAGTGLPPLSLVGRIFWGHPIIADYDRIFIAPLAIALSSVILPRVLNAMGVYPPLMAAIMATVLIAMTIGLPPRLRKWQLTGHSRMVVVRLQRGRAFQANVNRSMQQGPGSFVK